MSQVSQHASLTMDSQSQRNNNIPVQRRRWTFTLNNFNRTRDYRMLLSDPATRVKRAVLGFEYAPTTGTPHIQGYAEFERSVRLGYVKKILPLARWEGAVYSPERNYRYCIKGGDFQTVGDFSVEEGLVGGNRACRPASIPMILEGMLDKTLAPQIRVSKEYAEKFMFFERTSKYLRYIQVKLDLFQEWCTRRLYMWQYNVLGMILEQGPRRVLWICDPEGNTGKTFLGQYLSILYNFQQLDGVIPGRDLVQMIDEDANGFSLDVCREKLAHFNYSVVESLKNGFMITGKYGGSTKRFGIMPVVVFANGYPTEGMLSRDRWQIVTLGQHEFMNMEKTAVVSPREKYPFKAPASMPNLQENFGLRNFLLSKINESEAVEPANEVNAVTSVSLSSSQIPAPSHTTSPICARHPNQGKYVYISI